MKLYRIAFASRVHWYGTQADANAGKRQHSVGWSGVDVPTDKAGLLAFLNERDEELTTDELADLAFGPIAAPVEPEALVRSIATAIDQTSERRAQRIARQADTDGLVDWLLEEADQAQVEAIFTAIGCRFGEARPRRAA